MDLWTKGLTAWAGFLGMLLMMAAVADDGPDDPYAPRPAYEAAEPSPTEHPAETGGTDGATHPPLDDTYHTGQTNVSSIGSGHWSHAFPVNATSVQNLSVSVTFEPRAGQTHWSATFSGFDLVDPDGVEQWRSDGSFGNGGPPAPATRSTTIPGEDVVDGVWEFTFRWDGPTDVRLTLEVWAERGAPPQ